MFPVVQLKQASIGSSNGLVPNRQQTIIWTNDDLVYWFIDTALSLNEVTHDILMACNEGLW